MIIPVWSGGPLVEDADGNPLSPTQETQGLLNQTLTELQSNVGEDGFAISQSPASDVVTKMANMPLGTVLFDVDSDEWVGKNASGLVKFTVTPYP
ncbi:MAG: hypothetical protein V4501_11230 [Pseudomonadota bacterium]